MGSAAGARKTAARRLGMSLAAYDARLLAGEKWCRSCRAWHPVSHFSPDRSRGDGLSAVCAASRRSTRPGPSRADRIARKAQGQGWCRCCQEWSTDALGGLCRSHRNADSRARYARDPEPVRQRVYARARGLETIPAWWIREQRANFGGLCAYGCGEPATTNDHIWPVAAGGRSNAANIVPACRTCNSRKRDHDPLPWVERGIAAFPAQWDDLVALALETNCDEWMGAA